MNISFTSEERPVVSAMIPLYLVHMLSTSDTDIWCAEIEIERRLSSYGKKLNTSSIQPAEHKMHYFFPVLQVTDILRG